MEIFLHNDEKNKEREREKERMGQSDMNRNGKLYTKTTFSKENMSSVYLCKTHHHNDSVFLSGY